MVLVLEDYYCPDTQDMTFSAPAIPKEGIQKAGKKPQAKVYVPHLLRAADKSVFDDDEELTPVENTDGFDDTLVSTKIQHAMPSVPQKSQPDPSTAN